MNDEKTDEGEKEQKLERLSQAILYQAMRKFQDNPNGFVEPFLIQKLSDKYIETLRHRFSEELTSEVRKSNLPLQNSETENESLISAKVEERIQEKLHDKLMEKKLNQQHRLKNWFEYLLIENEALPAWYRYLVLRSIVTFIDRDTASQNRKRNPYIAENYLQLDRQILPKVLNDLNAPDKVGLKFFDLYKKELKNKKEQLRLRQNIPQEEYFKGTWMEFEMIENSVKTFDELGDIDKKKILALNKIAENSPWCLVDAQTALTYLQKGPIRIYQVNGVPEIALNIEVDAAGSYTLREARGSLEDEGFHEKIIPVLEELYKQLEIEGIDVPKSRHQEIREQKEKIEFDREKARIMAKIDAAFESNNLESLDRSDVEHLFNLYNSIISGKSSNVEAEYMDSEFISKLKILGKRYVTEVLEIPYSEEEVLFPESGIVEEAEYDLDRENSDEERFLVNFKICNLNMHSEDIQLKYAPRWEISYASGLRLNNIKDLYRGTNSDYQLYTPNFFPNLKKVGLLEMENAVMNFEKLEEIDELVVRDSRSNIECENLKRIKNLLIYSNNSRFLYIDSSKVNGLILENIEVPYEVFFNNKNIFTNFDKSALKSLKITFSSDIYSLNENFLERLDCDDTLKESIVFQSSRGQIEYTYSQISELINFKKKLKEIFPKFTKAELEQILGLKKLTFPYSLLPQEIKYCYDKIISFPQDLSNNLKKLFPDYNSIATKISEITNETQVVFTINSDTDTALNTDEFNSLDNLVFFKGGLLTVFDSNNNLSSLESVYGDIDLSFCEEIPNLEKLDIITGTVFISEDSPANIQDFARSLALKTKAKIEMV